MTKGKKIILLSLILFVSLAFLAESWVFAFLGDSIPADASYKPDELLVRFAPKATGIQCSTTEKNEILNALGGGVIKRDYKIVPGLSLVKLPDGVTVQDALKTFNKANGILYAEPDYEIKLLSTFPNDPRFNELWGMHNTGQSGGTLGADIDAPEAWDISTGSRNIIVAVTDTGVDYTHPDLSANMWRNPGEIPDNGIDDDDDGYVDDVYGWDFADDDNDPMDYLDHGTHCSGTIGAVGDNAEGVAGVCWNVKIMSLKVFPNYGEEGFISGAIAAVQYAIDKGAKVINASWGGYSYSQALYDVIAAARDAGILFVAAAGNEENDNDGPYSAYPASYNLSNIISVMATNDNDGKSYYSNYGLNSVDIGSPGGSMQYYGDPRGILSCLPNANYGYMQGTSMAAPHVAGACALLLSINPSLTYSQVKQILLSTVDPTLPGLCISGGRLNLFAAALTVPKPVPGSIVGWGRNTDVSGNWSGQAKPPLGNDFIAIAAGRYHSLALRSNGTIVGWGYDGDDGQATPPSGNDYVAIAAGGWHSLALRSDGSIAGWGWNYDLHGNWAGQATPPPGNDFIAIAAGDTHSLALKRDGSIVGWGDDEWGQATPPAGNNYIAIAAGEYHSLAIRSDGNIVSWGACWYGCGTFPEGNNYKAVDAGWHLSIALKSDGSIVGRGDNRQGQATPPAGNNYVAIAAGGYHSLALRSDGSIVGWGKNWFDCATPPVGNDFIAIAAGGFHNLALASPRIPVTIDIKAGNVPVAILSSATFDATTIDRSTVEFAGAHPLNINYCSQLGEIPEDVDGDGLLDIVFYFKTSDLNLLPDDTEACLTGRTSSGQRFEGCDNVLSLGPAVGDFDWNGRVDLADYAIFSSRWLECTDPNCE